MKFSEFIEEDRNRYFFLENKVDKLKKMFFKEHEYTIWRYLTFLRKEEYYFKIGFYILSAYYRRRKNMLGEKLGFTIPKNVFGPGLLIWHYGNIVVNSHAKVGKNCTLHGDNCIGNNGTNNLNPVIGDNVDIGVGAKIIGAVTIANNVTIGAGSVVVKDILTPNVVVAGVPAKIIRNK